MNKDLYLEFASRSGEFQFRQRLLSLPATVGRSLQNDFVVDDPYVAASHLEISNNPDQPDELLIRDLGSRNGLFVGNERVQQIVLQPGKVLRFGHTTLRLRTPTEAVEAERVDAFASRAFSIQTGIALLALITLIALLQKPLNQFTEISAKDWMTAVFGPLGLVLGWSALWAMATRLFSGRAQFGAHLSIACWTMLAAEAIGQVFGLSAFAFSLPALVQIATPLSIAICIWALFRHLSLAQLRWPRANLPLALALTALPVSLWLISNWDQSRTLLGERLINNLYDPSLRVAKGLDPARFISHIGALQADVDAQRAAGKDLDSSDAADEEEDETENTE